MTGLQKIAYKLIIMLFYYEILDLVFLFLFS